MTPDEFLRRSRTITEELTRNQRALASLGPGPHIGVIGDTAQRLLREHKELLDRLEDVTKEYERAILPAILGHGPRVG